MNKMTKAGLAVFTVAILISISVLYIRRDSAMHDIISPLNKFDLALPPPQCARWKDSMPKTRDADAYQLYISARKAWRSKRPWVHSSDENKKILESVNAAASAGDWGARALMSHFYLNGLGMQEVNRVLEPHPDKAVELMMMAVRAGQAWGYYDLGVAVEHGYGQLDPNEKDAWRLYLKAAQLGSPDAQIVLAQAYTKARNREASLQMLMCAFEQGSGTAAHDLGRRSFREGRQVDGVRYFQEGVKFGSARSASSLYLLFSYGKHVGSDDDENLKLAELGYGKDKEREKRYDEIADALEINPDLRFPLIDSAVPLPPAALGRWNGLQEAIGSEPEGPPTY